MTIYEGWELPASFGDWKARENRVNVGKPYKRVDPSAKAKTVKLGMKFTGPYEYLDTAAGEMRQTMPTLTRDEIRLQAGLLRHSKRNQTETKSIWEKVKSFL